MSSEAAHPHDGDGHILHLVRQLTVDDLAVALGRASAADLYVVTEVCGVHLRQGKGRANAALTAPRLAGVSAKAATELGQALTAGAAADAGPGDQSEVAAGLLRSWPVGIVSLWCALSPASDGDFADEAEAVRRLLCDAEFNPAFVAAGHGEPEALRDLVVAVGLDPRPFLAAAHGDDIPAGPSPDESRRPEEEHPGEVEADDDREATETWRSRLAAAEVQAQAGALVPADALDVVVEALAAQTAAGEAELLPPAVVATAGRAGTVTPSDQTSRWFHIGLLDGQAGSGEAPAGGPEAAAWRAGRLVGGQADDHPAEDSLAALLDTPDATGFAADVLRALFDSDPVRAARVAAARHSPFPGWESVVHAGLARAEGLASAGDLLAAEAVVTELVAAVGFWAPDGPSAAASLSLAAVTYRRRRHDWSGARRLLDRGRPYLTRRADLASAALEAALIAAGVADPLALRLPRTRAEAETLAGRVRPALPHLRAAADLAPDAPEPPLLAGLVAWADGDDEGVVDHFGRVEALAAAADPELLSALRFERARSQLRLLEPGRQGGAVTAALTALAAGHSAGEADLVEMLTTAESLEQSGRWRLALEGMIRHPSNPVFNAGLAVAAEAGVPGAIAGAQDMAITNPGVPTEARFGLLEAALAGAERAGGPEVDGIIEAIESLLERAGQAELDSRWADLLGESEGLRDRLTPAAADGARVEVLRRAGRVDEARAVAAALFYRALGKLDTDPAAQLDLLAELAAPADQLDELRSLLNAAAPLASITPEGAVTILFVGGDETQSRYHAGIDAALAARYRGAVTVEWWAPGWSSNWAPVAEAVERRYRAAGALVLMTYVRTNFGRRLRASSGEAGVPWVSCTGHGRAAMDRAIDRAVAVARRRPG